VHTCLQEYSNPIYLAWDRALLWYRIITLLLIDCIKTLFKGFYFALMKTSFPHHMNSESLPGLVLLPLLAEEAVCLQFLLAYWTTIIQACLELPYQTTLPIEFIRIRTRRILNSLFLMEYRIITTSYKCFLLLFPFFHTGLL